MPQPTPEQDDQARLFREVVLVLGGVFAVQGTDDETIRRVATGLECVYRRARQNSEPTTATLVSHEGVPQAARRATSVKVARTWIGSGVLIAAP